jgi:hypothetical protein
VHAVRALQGFFFPVGLKRGEAFFAPRRLRYVLRSTIFADQVLAHGFGMLKTGSGIFILKRMGAGETGFPGSFWNSKCRNEGADVIFLR